MAKSAQQKMNEFWAESDRVRATIKAFSDAAYDNYGSHSYAAGWLESTVASLIMQLPKARRADALREFEVAARKQRLSKEQSV